MKRLSLSPMVAFVFLSLADMAGIAAIANVARADDSLTLIQALEELDRHNPTLAEAKSRIDEAESLVAQATSVLLPTLSIAGGYTRNSDEATLDLRPLANALAATGMPVGEFPQGVTIQPRDAFTASGAVRIPIFMPSAMAERSAAQHGRTMTLVSAEAVRLRLRALLRQTAHLALAQEETATATEKAVASAQAHRDRVARAVQVGTSASLALLTAETELVKRKSDWVRAQSEVARGRQVLGALLGRQQAVRVQVEARLPEEGPSATSAQVEDAYLRRPEVRLEEARKAVASAQALSAKLRWAPQLAASAALFTSTSAYPTGERAGWRLTLDATWALYDGGWRKGRLAQAKANQAVAQAAKTRQEIQIQQEITDAAREIRVALQRLRLAEQQGTLAREAAASATRSFAAGVVGSLEVLDANDRLYQADIALAEARGRLGVAFTIYDLARGY